MFIKFANGKCPVCGNGGNAIDKNLFKCARCDMAYDVFGIFNAPSEGGDYWS